jgi:hypothetical protein
MKSILKSRTLWLAVAQSVVGIVVVFSTTYPDVGWLLTAKSVLDIVLRFLTTQPIGVVTPTV